MGGNGWSTLINRQSDSWYTIFRQTHISHMLKVGRWLKSNGARWCKFLTLQEPPATPKTTLQMSQVWLFADWLDAKISVLLSASPKQQCHLWCDKMWHGWEKKNYTKEIKKTWCGQSFFKEHSLHWLLHMKSTSLASDRTPLFAPRPWATAPDGSVTPTKAKKVRNSLSWNWCCDLYYGPRMCI